MRTHLPFFRSRTITFFSKFISLCFAIMIIGSGLSAQSNDLNKSSYQVEIVTKSESKIVAFVLHTTFVENRQAREIPPFFHKIMEENSLESVPNRINKNQVCVFDKKPDSPAFDYYMGVEVNSVDSLPKDMKTFVIPESMYAATSFVKTGNMDVLQALKYLTEKWIPESEYKQNQAYPVFINYGEKFISIYKTVGYDGKPVATLYIPVLKK